jgi:hypothetical protein
VSILGKLLEERGTVKGLRMGVIAPARPTIKCHPPLGTPYGFEQVENYGQFHTLPDDQQFSTCVSNGTCGVIESEIFRRGGKIVQLNYNKLYLAARRLLYGDKDMDAGLQLADAAEVAIEVGLLPDDTEIRRITVEAGAMCHALKTGPLITAHMIDNGWLPKNLDVETGAIDESYSDSAYDLLNEQLGGHCTVCCASNIHNSQQLYVHRNSWGALGIDDSGLICMTAAYSISKMLDKPVLLVMGPKWKDWKLDNAWVVTKAEG